MNTNNEASAMLRMLVLDENGAQDRIAEAKVTSEELIRACCGAIRMQVPLLESASLVQLQRLCERIVHRLHENGCTVQLGYEALLYPSEPMTSKLLRWLVDYAQASSSAITSKDAALGLPMSKSSRNRGWNVVIFDALKRWMMQPRIASSSHRGHALGLCDAAERIKQEEDAMVIEEYTLESHPRIVLPAVVDSSREAMQARYHSALARRRMFSDADSRGQVEDTKSHEEFSAAQIQFALLDAQVEDIVERIVEVDTQVELLQMRRAELSKLLPELVTETERLTIRNQLKQRALEAALRPDIDVETLSGRVQDKRSRIADLEEQWNEHKRAMEERIRIDQDQALKREEIRKRNLSEIKQIRSELRVVESDIRESRAHFEMLSTEQSKLPKSAPDHRFYQARIDDLVRNQNRQKSDIRKILDDINCVQMEINRTVETSQREFAVAEETLYRATQIANGKRVRDPDATLAYKHLLTMRDIFAELVNRTKETAKIRSETVHVRSQIEALGSEDLTKNRERIAQDLHSVKAENEQLQRLLKS